MQRIGELYAIEAAMRYATVDARHKYRQREAMPRLQAMHDWLINQRLKIADGSGLARAIDYSLKRWQALVRYANAGHLPIDNNPVENTIRPIAIGKNYAQSIIMQSWIAADRQYA